MESREQRLSRGNAWIFAVVLSLALAARWVDGARKEYPDEWRPKSGASHYTLDPDGNYHMRRVARALEEDLAVAATDPYMNFPYGADIPWPPYYDQALTLALAPFAPSGDRARLRDCVERTVGAAPMVFGAATSLCAAALGLHLAGPVAALFAGVHHALSFGSINYSVIGNGDHHAFVSFLLALLLLTLARAFSSPQLQPRRGLSYGLLAGLLVALLLGSWVASLLYLFPVELALVCMLWLGGPAKRAGLAVLGSAMHAGALALLLPAVLASPWRMEQPWMVVNLSWFHAAHLALGALVFAPFWIGLPSGGQLQQGSLRWIASVALLLFGVLFAALAPGPASGIRAGFEWASRSDRFMSGVQESYGLLDPRGRGLPDLFLALGYLAPLAVLAWCLAIWRVFRNREHALVPLAFALPLLSAQALQQRRFADALAMPLAVLLAWFLAVLLRRWIGSERTRVAWPVYAGALVLACVGQWGTCARTARNRLHPVASTNPRRDRDLGLRLLLDWLREQGAPERDGAVLANWDLGHGIEWIADRPSVATNFGSYVGEESFAAPAAFFLETDEARAEACLSARRVRYVLATSDLPRNTRSMISLHAPERAAELLRGESFSEQWFFTMAARLLAGGVPAPAEGAARGNPLPFLRLVHVSPVLDQSPHAHALRPRGFVWEHVPGALLEVHGDPGSTLAIELVLHYLEGAFTLKVAAQARADEHGIARLRLPYATEGKNGDGTPAAPAQWSFAGEKGTLVVSEAAIQAGKTIVLGSGP
jgi:dolichyl-diphosphooligosaccharide--protein glycosyltransferase